jgi:Txe/YoeB family toxin of Txe-Axe toxin-antitoxin module
MRVVSLTEARNNLKSVSHSAYLDNEEVIIDEYKLVYEVSDYSVVIISCKYHR